MSLLAGLAPLGGRVAVAAGVAALLVVLVALALRLLPSLPPRLRAGLWWLVAARTLLDLAGAPALELAWLPVSATAPESTRIVVLATSSEAASSPESAGQLEPAEPKTAPAAATVSQNRSGDLRRTGLGLLGGFWIFSVLAASAAAARELVLVRRRLARSRPVADVRLLELLESLRRKLGPSRPVRVVCCDDLATPHVVGWWRPVIVLPSGGLSDEELRFALAHELLHLRRGDALRGFVPWLAGRLFTFHPLVRWSAREYVLANESACDAEVVARLGASPARYGRLLLRLAAQPLDARTAAAGWALARRPIERRLDMLARIQNARRPARTVLVALALLAAVAAWPIRLVGAIAAEPPDTSQATQASPANAEEPSPPTAETPAAEPGERWPAATRSRPVRPAVPAVAPLPPVPPTPVLSPRAGIAPRAPVAPRPPITPRAAPRPVATPTPSPAWTPTPPIPPTPPTPSAAPTALREPSPPPPPLPPTPYASPAPPVPPTPPPPGFWRGASFVLLDGDSRVMVNAGAEEVALAERSRRGNEPVLVLRRGARSRVIHDRAAIDSLAALLEEQHGLAEQQARIENEMARRASELEHLLERELGGQHEPGGEEPTRSPEPR